MSAEQVVAEIGRFIRQRRKASKLTQIELSEIAGVGLRFVSELERGKPTVRLAEVDAVLAVFGKQLGLVERQSEERNVTSSQIGVSDDEA